MTAPLPFRWSRDGGADALAAAEALAAGVVAGAGIPSGCRLVKDRPMRVTLAATLPGPGGPLAAFVKVRRLRTARERLRSGHRPRGAAEARVLAGLASAGVAVPDVVGFSVRPDLGWDVLVLEAVADGVDLGDRLATGLASRARRAVAVEVGALLRRAHDAGWADPDVHRGNLLVTPRGPVLLDPGTRDLAPPLPPHRRVAALAAAAHGLAPDARAALAALVAYEHGDRAAARRWFPLVAAQARRVARAYRRGRARRPTRTGRHFEVFAPTPSGGRAVRNLDATDATWKAAAAAWLDADPPGARPLKAGGRVVVFPAPGDDGAAGREVVLKRYAGTWRDRFRTPRAVRAFRRAYALRIRGVACPEPLLAAADGGGAGVYVAARAGGSAPAVDLHAAVVGAPGAAAPFGALAPAARRAALHRLGRFLRRLHDAEVVHRDLKAPNLVAWQTPRGVAYAVVDLDGARATRRPVPWRRRARDLARLDASVGAVVSRADRHRVLLGYVAAFERPGLPTATLARLVARASARKRGPTGRPR
ncbi:MAG: lipopolysaccharide kinase InaA family protein [Planctomycetota bacterium]